MTIRWPEDSERVENEPWRSVIWGTILGVPVRLRREDLPSRRNRQDLLALAASIAFLTLLGALFWYFGPLPHVPASSFDLLPLRCVVEGPLCDRSGRRPWPCRLRAFWFASR